MKLILLQIEEGEDRLLQVPERVYNLVKKQILEIAYKDPDILKYRDNWAETRSWDWLAIKATTGNPKAQETIILLQECDDVEYEILDIDEEF